MTEALFKPVTDSEIVKLPKSIRLHPHKFGDPTLVRRGDHSQTERTCVLCGAVKVTVHAERETASGASQHWREWRLKDDPVQFEAVQAPPCEGTA